MIVVAFLVLKLVVVVVVAVAVAVNTVVVVLLDAFVLCGELEDVAAFVKGDCFAALVSLFSDATGTHHLA